MKSAPKTLTQVQQLEHHRPHVWLHLPDFFRHIFVCDSHVGRCCTVGCLVVSLQQAEGVVLFLTFRHFLMFILQTNGVRLNLSPQVQELVLIAVVAVDVCFVWLL
jgi:hypothetical protein